MIIISGRINNLNGLGLIRSLIAKIEVYHYLMIHRLNNMIERAFILLTVGVYV